MSSKGPSLALSRPLATLTALAAAVALSTPAHAQFVFTKKKTPDAADLPAQEMEIWPYTLPDPQSWWDDQRIKPTEAADPLTRRRMGRGERLPILDNGVDPSTYRLWGLMPLQWQVVRGNETIIEVWVRPSGGVRQSVVRVTARGDGEAFIQARAGLACCEADIGRRMGFDAEAPAGSALSFQALAADPLWDTPRQVVVDYGGGASDALCVDGVSYDLTLVTRERVRTVRRACDNAEIGQAADVLTAVLEPAFGHDQRFDVIYPKRADFSAAKAAYASLRADGGRLKADGRRAVTPGELAPPPVEDVPQSPALQIPAQ